MKEEEGGVISTSLWARGRRAGGGREGGREGEKLIHKLRREEDAAERRQLGRRADREEKVLEKNSVMASSRTGSCSPTARGLMCPLLSAPDQGSPAWY